MTVLRFGQFSGNGLEGVVQQVTDVAGLQTGALADFLVRQILVNFKRINSWLRPSSVSRLKRTRPMPSSRAICSSAMAADRWYRGGSVGFVWLRLESDDLRGITPMVERQIMHSAIEPPAWLTHFGKMGVQFHERFLDQVLRHLAVANQAQRITQQRRFEGSKQLLNRFGRLRARFVWLARSHALLNDHLASPVTACATRFSSPAVAGLMG